MQNSLQRYNCDEQLAVMRARVANLIELVVVLVHSTAVDKGVLRAFAEEKLHDSWRGGGRCGL